MHTYVRSEPYLHQVLVDPFCESLFLNSVPFVCGDQTETQFNEMCACVSSLYDKSYIHYTHSDYCPQHSGLSMSKLPAASCLTTTTIYRVTPQWGQEPGVNDPCFRQ